MELGKVSLPALVFMFTIDQIAAMLSISEEAVRLTYLYYSGRSSGVKASHQMFAVNIAPESERADWRVSAEEFRKWLHRRGFKVSDRTSF